MESEKRNELRLLRSEVTTRIGEFGRTTDRKLFPGRNNILDIEVPLAAVPDRPEDSGERENVAADRAAAWTGLGKARREQIRERLRTGFYNSYVLDAVARRIIRSGDLDHV